VRRAGTAQTVGVAILSVTLLSGCGGAPHAARATTGPPSERPSVSADTLARVVLQPDEAPAGTAYFKAQSGPQSVEDLLHSGSGVHEAQQQLRRTGFQKAYRALFVGAATGPGTSATQRSLASFAVSFRDAAAAQQAQVILGDAISGARTDLKPVPATGLGAGARGFSAPLPALNGSTFYYSWVRGSAVLMVIDSGGSTATSPTTSLATARQVDAVAARAAGAGETSSLVLPADRAPRGTVLAKAKSGPQPVRKFGGGDTATRLRALGARSAYANLFQTPQLVKPPKRNPSDRSNVVSSQAQAYDIAAHASAAYRLLVGRERKLFEGHPVTAAPSNGLGAEATGFRYVDKKPDGDVVGIAYYWREANAVYILSVVGDPAFSTVENARALARKMGS
jgi:hypothetical protein